MTSDSDAGEARLNPRTRRVRQAILDAAMEVLLEQGPQEVTANRVAEHADVARTTIYRHWPDQASLLLATIDALAAPHYPTSSVGCLADDLRTALENLRTRLVKRNLRSIFGALAAYAARDEAFADAQRRFIQQITQPTVDILGAGQERGELDPGLDFEFEATLLAGPVLHQYLVLQNDVTDRFIDEITARWLAPHDLR